MESRQWLHKILAALSHSKSMVMGQNASLPSLFDRRLTGAPSLSVHAHNLSKPAFPPDLVLDHTACVSGMVAVDRGKRGKDEGCAVHVCTSHSKNI